MSYVFALSSAVARGRRPGRGRLLPRVLGFYIAACAGGIQVLDIAVDRLGLDERMFAFALVLAVLGIPFSGLAAVMVEVTRAERTAPRQSAAPRPQPHTAAPGVVVGEPAAPEDIPTEHTRRLERALASLRAVQMSAADTEVAAAQHRRSIRELKRLVADLEDMIESLEERARAGAP